MKQIDFARCGALGFFALLLWYMQHMTGMHSTYGISLAAYTAPLVGLFGTTSDCIGLWIGRITCLVVAPTAGGTTLHIPTMLGSCALSDRSRTLFVLVPLACMAAFGLHPVGSQCWYYGLYWLIPIVVSLLPYHTLFLRCLAATFVTHAVGSVLYLYMHQTDPRYWQLLMAVILIERVLHALMLTGIFYGVTYLQQRAHHALKGGDQCQTARS